MHNLTPYEYKPHSEWKAITEALIELHPLSSEEIISIVKKSWDQIFSSKIGGVIQIGEDIALTPQMIGNFMHVLIAHNLSASAPKLWRKEAATNEKDIVFLPDDFFSFEIKCSSSKNDIYGNRSYGQQSGDSSHKKSKDGFYLTVNFTKPVMGEKSHITKIKFGWLDHIDWIAQKAETGQQSRLRPETKKYKLLTLYTAD